ncbi:hypothetical protein H0H81_012478 [Sphagnurus paluster]|uniref:Zn(2)-C6 fungal-type domain-containing protein n=1 Tax=Sphagnurus paluster TaxID=117069 RepID=A0A9P7GMT7_9AGAR|nr:hypothetical protein H0H81_012478 [Sphagnurus paluster]
MYPPYYSHYQHGPPQHLPQHLALPPNYSSPSSQGSEALGTPPGEHMYGSPPSNTNGKRPASNGGPSDSRKKPRKDESSEPQSPAGEKEETKAKPTRGSRACTVCRRLKMKCVGAEQGGPCKRCMAGNHECIFEESNRGKRSSKKHELLTRSLRKMERTLDTVLRSIGNPGIASGMVSRSPSPTAQAASTSALIAASPSPPPSRSASFHQNEEPGSPKLHSLPDNTLNPLGLLAEASLANRRAHNPSSPILARTAEPGDQPKVGVASDNYFKPGVYALRWDAVPRSMERISDGGVYPYYPPRPRFPYPIPSVFPFSIPAYHKYAASFNHIAHTNSKPCSPVCSIASKFYTEKPELHPRLTELAKKLAFSVPAQGYKSVEIVQGYLLLSLWGCGAVERFEQDKTWLLLGMAIRMATDLNLHRKTAASSQDTQEGRARDLEVHNRERTWLMCFCLDRSFSAQMGKPHSIKEDAIIRNAEKWARSPVANKSDPSLCAYVDLQRILSRSLEFLYSGTDTPSGLQVHCDYLLVIKTFEMQLAAWLEKWTQWTDENEKVRAYKTHISRFYYNYAMLVLNSFGLQNAMERSKVDIAHFFARCHSCATICATIVRDELGPTGHMRYAPDSHCVLTSYAVLSLLKLIRPEFRMFLENEEKTIKLVADVANVLESNAANPLHTPALYAHFLRALIAAKKESSRPVTATNGADANANGTNDDNTASTPSRNNVPLPEMGFQYSHENGYNLGEFQFESEMGPVADMSTFPPTMAPHPTEDNMGALTMDNILSTGFWDSVLVPGYNSMDGLSGGFLFGAGGSGLITPGFGMSPMHSGANTPGRGGAHSAFTQMNITAAFDNRRVSDTKLEA